MKFGPDDHNHQSSVQVQNARQRRFIQLMLRPRTYLVRECMRLEKLYDTKVVWRDPEHGPKDKDEIARAIVNMEYGD